MLRTFIQFARFIQDYYCYRRQGLNFGKVWHYSLYATPIISKNTTHLFWECMPALVVFGYVIHS